MELQAYTSFKNNLSSIGGRLALVDMLNAKEGTEAGLTKAEWRWLRNVLEEIEQRIYHVDAMTENLVDELDTFHSKFDASAFERHTAKIKQLVTSVETEALDRFNRVCWRPRDVQLYASRDDKAARLLLSTNDNKRITAHYYLTTTNLPKELEIVVNKFAGITAEEEQEEARPSNLALLLERYYANGCKLNKQQVEKISKENGVGYSGLEKKWNQLKENGYQHTSNTNNIRAFHKAYTYLLKRFAGNQSALTHVKNRYNQLLEMYPDAVE